YPSLLAGLRASFRFLEPMLLDASQFGVAQTRKRLFLVCDRDEPIRRLTGRVQCRPARSVLDWSGRWNSKPLYVPGRAEATIERAERAIARLGRRVPFLIVYYGSDGAGGWQPVDRPLRTLTTLDRFGLVTWAGDTPMLRMLQVPELVKAMGFRSDFRVRH